MASPTVIDELDVRNQTSFQRLISSYMAALDKEAVGAADILRLCMKAEIEAADVAALWLVDCDDLELKLLLAEQCGTAAATVRVLREQIATAAPEAPCPDPREGGYSKLFAFLRSLQTREERLSAEHLTRKGLGLLRTPLLASWCEQHGDPAAARLLRDTVAQADRSHYERGRAMLVAVATAEESQARARRAAFRAIELLTEMAEPVAVRKALGRRR